MQAHYHFGLEPVANFDETEDGFALFADGLASQPQAEWVRRRQPAAQRTRAPQPTRSNRPQTGARGRRSYPWPGRAQPSSEYVRWVQSALNQILALRLPLDGVMGPALRSALRSFQKREGLPINGVVGPETEQALIEARKRMNGAAQKSVESVEPQGEWFEFEQSYLETPASQPLLRRGSNGLAVVDLQTRLATFGFSPGSADGIFGSLTETAVKNFQRSRGLSADGIVGSQTWEALLATTSPQPREPSGSPAPAPKDLPAAWSNGPVNAPVWRPEMVSYDSITCGSREIPVGLRPESVTQGWTARTQAMVNIIRGPLFGWKNVEGGATGDQTGHISGSYHYCGRAIDSFAPGVLWNTRATGTGLSASWRLANWAAHNAAALNVSEVIFYDLIWTAAKGGWRPYRNSGLSENPDWENSLQHRDHVHISIY